MLTGSSSSSTTTIGDCVTPPIVRALASFGNASSEIEPLNRNSARNTIGAGDRMLRKERTGSARSHSSAAATPIATEPMMSTRSEASISFFSAWTAISVTSPAIRTTCAMRRGPLPARPTSSSSASSSAGGSTTSSTEKEMMSKPDEPRAAKNSGLSLSRSKSGWATAKHHSTARLRYDHAASFTRLRLGAGLRLLHRSFGGAHPVLGRA